MLTRKGVHICRSVYSGKGVCTCRAFGNDFHVDIVTALQLKCDLLSSYFMDPNGLIPDENSIRSEAKNCEFEVTTLY